MLSYPNASLVTQLSIDHRIALGCYDLDGNILHTDTPQYRYNAKTAKEVCILSSERCAFSDDLSQFEKYPNQEATYSSFRDHSFRNDHPGFDGLLQDIQKTVEQGAFGASFPSFRTEFLIKARCFSIITGRGHSPDNIQKGIELINHLTLDPAEKEEQMEHISHLWEARFPGYHGHNDAERRHWYFTEMASYFPVSNPHLHRGYPQWHESGVKERKTIAMYQSIQYVRNLVSDILHICPANSPMNIGFSDDTLENIDTMMVYLNKIRAWPNELISSHDKVRLYHSAEGHLHVIRL